MRQKITPNLWFETEAEEAAGFYTSVFENSRITSVTHYTEAGPRPAGMVMTVEFQAGRSALHRYQRRRPVHLQRGRLLPVTCETQDEIDYVTSRR